MAGPTTPPVSSYPPGTNFWETPDWAGGLQANLNIALVVISISFVAIRLYTRLFMSKTPGWDDAIAMAALCVVCSQSAVNIHLTKVGAGAHMELIPLPLLLQFSMGLTNLNLLYFWGVGLDRLAILAFLPRLNKDRNYLVMVWITGSMIIVATITCFFIRLLQCTPISDGWLPPMTPGTKCLSPVQLDDMMLSHAILGLLFDIVLMGLPMWVIYTKMIWSRKMFQVIAVFSVGIFVVIASMIRLYYIRTMDWATDSTFKMATIGVWSDLESHIGLWCGCFPALQPILRQVSYKLGLRSSLDSYVRSRKLGGATGGVSNGSRVGPSALNRSSNRHKKSLNGIDTTAGLDNDSQENIIKAPAEIEMSQFSSKIRKETEIRVQVRNREA